MPGTALVMGVRKPAGGAITSRSVCGVNANGGNPGRELLGGVVAGLAVVRSALSKQVASANLALSRSSKRSHRVAAEPGMLPEAKTVRATRFNRNTRERYMQVHPSADFIRLLRSAGDLKKCIFDGTFRFKHILRMCLPWCLPRFLLTRLFAHYAKSHRRVPA